jgi:hypothetical protein
MNNALDFAASRKILTTLEEYRQAAAQIIARAERSLCIYTGQLEPEIYDHPAFVDPVKRLLLGKSHARLKVLIADPEYSLPQSGAFMSLAHRLKSFIDIRNLPRGTAGNACAFIVADDRAVAYRMASSRWEGVVELNDQPIARYHLSHFNAAWDGSLSQSELPEWARDN